MEIFFQAHHNHWQHYIDLFYKMSQMGLFSKHKTKDPWRSEAILFTVISAYRALYSSLSNFLLTEEANIK